MSKVENIEPVRSLAKDNSPSSGEAGQWTFILGTDTISRRQAKSHVNRDTKRRKTVQAQAVRDRKARSRRKLAPAAVIQRSEMARSSIRVRVHSPATILGAGRVDPFAQYPVGLETLEVQELVDHYLYTAPSVSLKPQKRVCFLPLFQEIRRVNFQLAQYDASAFHTILAIASADRSILHDEEKPMQAIAHNISAIQQLSKRLSDAAEVATDGTITAVGLQVMFLLLFDDCSGIEAHLDALERLVNLRGGVDTFEDSNPQLLMLINLADYLPPATSLLGKRRFHHIDEAIIDQMGISPVAYTAPYRLESLAFFDVYFDIVRICQSLQRASIAVSSGDAWTFSVTGTKSKSQLQDLLVLGTADTAWGRRCEIMKCVYYAALIFMLIIKRQQGDLTSAYQQVSQLLLKSDVPWKNSLELLAQELISGDPSGHFVGLASLMRVACTVDQQSWKDLGGHLRRIYENFQDLPLKSTRSEVGDPHDTDMTGLAALFGYFNIGS